jgi:anti-anti-sigma factor
MPASQNCRKSADSEQIKNISPALHDSKNSSTRLSHTMQFMQTTTGTPTPSPALYRLQFLPKEPKLKLNLETRRRGDIYVVHCHGRIVYRDEAAAFSRAVGDLLAGRGRVVVDLAGVACMDGTGLGELVLLHTRARTKDAELRCAAPQPFVRHLLDLTRVDSLVEVHSTISEAISAIESQPAEVCADC